jgi:hypothetical protein
VGDCKLQLESPKDVSGRWTVVYQEVAKACRTTESSKRGGDKRQCIWECPRHTGRLGHVVDLIMPKIHRYSTVEVQEVELNKWCTWEAQSIQEIRSMRGRKK